MNIYQCDDDYKFLYSQLACCKLASVGRVWATQCERANERGFGAQQQRTVGRLFHVVMERRASWEASLREPRAAQSES